MTSMLLRRFTANSCTASILQPPAENYARVAFDVAVALVCMLSLLLCGRSILRGIMLQQVRKALSNQGTALSPRFCADSNNIAVRGEGDGKARVCLLPARECRVKKCSPARFC